MPDDALQYYKTATKKQLKARLSFKLGRLQKTEIAEVQNKNIREELEKVMLLENQLRSKEQNIEKKATVEQEKDKNSDHREELLKNLSDQEEDETFETKDENEINEPVVSTSNQKDKGDRTQKRKQEVEEPKKAKKPKRASLMDTIRQNHLSYQKCITKKMPKILRAIGIRSSSESDED